MTAADARILMGMPLHVQTTRQAERRLKEQMGR